MPGRINTSSILAIQQTILLPNDCKLRPTELRAELETAFGNSDFTDTLDASGKLNV